MKKIKSNLEKAKELTIKITNETPYKAKMAYLTALYFAPGYTISISTSFFCGLRIVYNKGELDYYTSYKELSQYEKEVLTCIEKLTGKEISIRDEDTITFGGR